MEKQVVNQQHTPDAAQPPRLAVDFFVRRWLLVLGAAAFFVALLWFVGNVLNVLLLLFAGLLFAVLLRLPTRLLVEHTPLGDTWAFGLVLLAVIGILALTAWLIGPSLAGQFDGLAQALPAGVTQVQQYLGQYAWGRWLLQQLPSVSDMLPDPGSLVGRITGIFSNLLGLGTSMLVVVFVGLYLGFQPDLYREGAVGLLPKRFRKRGHEVLHELGRGLTWWLIGRLFSMVVLGICTWLGLLLIGVPLALPLGVISGVFNFIPIIGPILGITPAAIVALTISPATMAYVLLLYIAVQIVESYILTPAVQQRAVQLPPVFALTVQLMLGVFAGTLGVALAVPFAVVLQVLVKLLYVEDVLGERVEMGNQDG